MQICVGLLLEQTVHMQIIRVATNFLKWSEGLGERSVEVDLCILGIRIYDLRIYVFGILYS